MKVIVEHIEAGSSTTLRIVGDHGAEITINYSEPLTIAPQLEIGAPKDTVITSHRH